MHWTISAGTLLHLLFCALIVAASFVCSLIVPNDKTDLQTDFNHFASKYFGENETHNNDKRLIIEDFYRQSALAAKSIQEMSFRLNQSSVDSKLQSGENSSMVKNFSMQTSDSHNNEGKKQSSELTEVTLKFIAVRGKFYIPSDKEKSYRWKILVLL